MKVLQFGRRGRQPLRRGVGFTLTALLLAAPASLSAATDAAPTVPAPRIDRQAVVTRHNVELHEVDARASLQVGNGDFAVGTDVTGLQTFCGYTLSNWGWHEEPLPAGLKPEDRKRTEFVSHDRKRFYREMGRLAAGAVGRTKLVDGKCEREEARGQRSLSVVRQHKRG